MTKKEITTGAGRPYGSTGNELKKRVTVRIYPSKIEILKDRGLSLQVLVDDLIEKNTKPQRKK